MTKEEKIEYDKKRYIKNAEEIKEYQKEYRNNPDNKRKISERQKVYAERNKEIIKEKRKKAYHNKERKILNEEEKKLKSEYNKTYYQQNKTYIDESRKEYQKEYRIENLDYIKERLRREENIEKRKESNKIYKDNNKDKANEYYKNRRKNNPLFKLTQNIRNVTGRSFRDKGYTKKSRTYEILGCSYEMFFIYLESQFESWMSWENRGLYNGELNYGWDIDHIIPLSSARTKEEILKLSHYTNFQPLCSYTNRHIKRDNII